MLLLLFYFLQKIGKIFRGIPSHRRADCDVVAQTFNLSKKEKIAKNQQLQMNFIFQSCNRCIKNCTDIGRRMRNFCLHLQYRNILHSPADVCIEQIDFLKWAIESQKPKHSSFCATAVFRSWKNVSAISYFFKTCVS